MPQSAEQAEYNTHNVHQDGNVIRYKNICMIYKKNIYKKRKKSIYIRKEKKITHNVDKSLKERKKLNQTDSFDFFLLFPLCSFVAF